MATLEERTINFITRAKHIHGDKYDYSKVIYKNSDTKIIVTCHIHGDFYPSPTNHVSRKSGCPQCAIENASKNLSSSTDEFVKKAEQIHGNRYDYSKVSYINSTFNVIIWCNDHRISFKQTPSNHLNGARCPKCALESRTTLRRKPLSNFISECVSTHADLYDYSKVTQEDYNNWKITIICKKHGEFTQNTGDHLYSKSGCPHCLTSKGENEIKKILDKLSINYIQQKSYNDLWHKSKKHKLRYDFYLSDHNILLEYDGVYHYRPFNSNLKEFKNAMIRDGLKDNYAKEHNILLIRIPYLRANYIEYIIKSLTYLE
jgi:hypothetical protein